MAGNRSAADPQQHAREVRLLRQSKRAPAEQRRHHHVVAHHDRQRRGNREHRPARVVPRAAAKFLRQLNIAVFRVGAALAGMALPVWILGGLVTVWITRVASVLVTAPSFCSGPICRNHRRAKREAKRATITTPTMLTRTRLLSLMQKEDPSRRVAR